MSSPKTREGTSVSCAGLYSMISNDKTNTVIFKRFCASVLCVSFLLTVHVPQQWTWQIFETTLCWSSRWGALSQGGWSTSPTRSTSWSRWSRPSSRDNGGGGLSRWGRLRCVTGEMLSPARRTHLSSLFKQVIHNWTIPLHGERSDQILLTKTFEMLSRYSEHHCVDLNMWTWTCLL